MSMTIQQATKAWERSYRYLISLGDKAIPVNVDFAKITLEALRKRTPTMVTHEASIHACHTCPSCKNVVDEYSEFVPGQKIYIQAQWCKYCGQALKWEED